MHDMNVGKNIEREARGMVTRDMGIWSIHGFYLCLVLGSKISKVSSCAQRSLEGRLQEKKTIKA